MGRTGKSNSEKAMMAEWKNRQKKESGSPLDSIVAVLTVVAVFLVGYELYYVCVVYDGFLSTFLVDVKGIAFGMVQFLLAMWLFNKYFLPKITAGMISDAVQHLQHDSEIKPVIEKIKGIVNKLEPVVKQLRGFDLNGFQHDLEPLIETVKHVDPDKINELATTLKKLAENLQRTVETPVDIPEPD